MKNSTVNKVIGAGLLGMGLGFVTGILVAPRSGEQSRKLLMGLSKDGLTKSKEVIAELSELGQKSLHQVKNMAMSN